MKPKYIIGGVVAALLLAGVVIALENKKVEYMDFKAAAESGKKVQVAGTWVKEKGCTYDPASNQFRFTMRDEKGSVMPVVLDGAKPNNFEISTSIVATGLVQDGRLAATNILTKCPSKYEANTDALHPYKDGEKPATGGQGN